MANKYQRYMDASNKAADFFVRNIGEDGEFKLEGWDGDLSAIYKAPTLLLLAGRLDVAVRLLEFIRRKFRQSNGDFLSYPSKTGRDRRSNHAYLREFQGYMGAWIVTAAQRVGRFDISYPGYEFLQIYWSPTARTFITNEPFDWTAADQVVDVLLSSHLGILSLYCRDLEKARGAGDAVVQIVELQDDLDSRFVLRMWGNSRKLIKDRVTCPGADGICFLNRGGKDELFFMLGFPVIFLSKLYIATEEPKYLDTAKKILEFAVTCDESLYTFFLGHKVGYGASMVARITKEQKYIDLATRIADNLVKIQNEKGEFAADLITVASDRCDQVGEIGIWLREIYTELNGV